VVPAAGPGPHRRRRERAQLVPRSRQLTVHIAQIPPGIRVRQQPRPFAIEIHKAGYATGPTYAQSLINLMRQYNFYRFDR